MKKMPIIFDMTFNEDGDREVLHTVREEIRDLVNETLADGGHIIPTFKRDGTAVFCDAEGNWFTRRAVKTGKQAPEGFIALKTDPNTGTTFGWECIITKDQWRLPIQVEKIATTSDYSRIALSEPQSARSW